MITRLWQSSEEWLAILFQFLVLVDHDLVHKFFDDKQLRKSTNAAAVCSEVTNQELYAAVKLLRLHPVQAA